MSYLTRLTLVKLIAAGVIDIPTQLLNNSLQRAARKNS